MKPTPCSSERVTTQSLLLAGWHGVYTNGKQFWAHPDYCNCLVPFKIAAKIENQQRKQPGGD